VRRGKAPRRVDARREYAAEVLLTRCVMQRPSVLRRPALLSAAMIYYYFRVRCF